MGILEKIIADKRIEVEEKKIATPIDILEQKQFFERECYSLASKLKEEDHLGIIAELKRKSPSKQAISLLAEAQKVVYGYSQQDVAGISILTNQKYFGGTIRDLVSARGVCEKPLIRKEFIIDEYQIIEAKAAGADVVLLLANVLTKNEINSFLTLTHNIGMEALLEVREEEELDKIPDNIDIVGVNNRDLKTFKVDIDHSMKMLKLLPKNVPVIAESGLSEIENVVKLKRAGFDGFLMGEYFMRSIDPGKTVGEFIEQVNKCLTISA